MGNEDLIKRISDQDLIPDYKDGDVLLHTDVNSALGIVRTGINENFYDIQKLQNGETKAGDADKVDGADLSRFVDETLQSNDNKVPSSRQAKEYIDKIGVDLGNRVTTLEEVVITLPRSLSVDPDTVTGLPGTDAIVENTSEVPGYVNLKFTIPRGAVGQTGGTGPQGPKGEPGENATFTVLGVVDNVSQLPTDANYGDAYFVGTTNPRSVYIFDKMSNTWVNIGTIEGPQGPAGQDGVDGTNGTNGADGATGPQGETGVGMPMGGAVGQVVIKTSTNDYDFGFADLKDNRFDKIKWEGTQSAYDALMPTQKTEYLFYAIVEE